MCVRDFSPSATITWELGSCGEGATKLSHPVIKTLKSKKEIGASFTIPHLLEIMQREIDIFGLRQERAADVALFHALGPGQIDQVQLCLADRRRTGVAGCKVNRKDTVGPRRRHVHGRLCNHAVGVTEKERVERIFLAVDWQQRQVFEVHAPAAVLQQRDLKQARYVGGSGAHQTGREERQVPLSLTHLGQIFKLLNVLVLVEQVKTVLVIYFEVRNVCRELCFGVLRGSGGGGRKGR